MSNKKKEILLRAYIGFLAIFLLGTAIIGRAFYIQTSQGAYYRSLADSLTIFPKKIQAERGNIYSEDGRLLATTLPIFDIRIDFKTTYAHPEIFKENVDSVSLLLADMFKDKTAKQYKNELLRERKKKSRYYLLKRNITYNEMMAMKKWPMFRSGPYKSGMMAIENERRLLPFGLLAQRTIGFTNKDGKAVGIEGKYNEQLRGVQGQVMVQKIAGGVTVPIDSREQIAPQPGRDIYTTLDIELQDVAEDALYRALQHHNAEHGCVVLMEVKTGKIKAIANLGATKDSSYREGFNYAAGEATEPGSTFKLATVAALMEDGRVNNNTLVEIGDGIAKFHNLTIRDHEPPATPQLTVKRSVEVSSNVAFARLAYDNYSSNPSKFYQHLVDFGFTKPINMELPGMGKPVLADPKKWSGVSTAYLAHGYELQITPLHTLMFYNAIANGGVMVQPRIIEKVKEYNTTVDSSTTVVLNDKLLSKSTVKQLQEILAAVVENGTAKNLKTDYLHVAGKTGTAVIAQGNQGYKKRIYQASFCGYFPAEDPQYSMIVVINSPSTNGYYGNVVAGAIFKEVADKVYSLNMNMQPALNQQLAANHQLPVLSKGDAKDIEKLYAYLGGKPNHVDGEWTEVSNTGRNVRLERDDYDAEMVPDVTGMSMKDAVYLLETLGMRVNVIGRGNVVAQSKAVGETIVKGMVITIDLR
jgi:cell division protein FtsI (penicillin-binding protein 3)